MAQFSNEYAFLKGIVHDKGQGEYTYLDNIPDESVGEYFLKMIRK